MREKELRLALICYGGISLSVYMHGVTKEVWRLARASRSVHDAEQQGARQEVENSYTRLLEAIASECGIRLRVLVDILAGASAGGINAVFLGQSIATGQSLEPLTDLGLRLADVDMLLDESGGAVSRFAKALAVPIAWELSDRTGMVDHTVEPAHRDEIREKLANFIRSRWFAPPFSGAGFTRMLLDALDAMAKSPAGPPLLPSHQPLDLFVTVTDFHGHPERLRLHSPSEVLETEHRLVLSFRDAGGEARAIGEAPALAFAARATASFPGAFPPFTVTELDTVLDERGEAWPGRETFLQRALPSYAGIGQFDAAVLVDGSVLANAPFRPAIDALKSRPARREVDRRFVYIDPKPGIRSIRLTGGESEAPGFFSAIFGALSDIPREQPIRDSLDMIEARSSRIRQLRSVVDSMRPEVEAAIDRAFGPISLLGRPTAKRIAGWRERAHNAAAREAGFAYGAYAHLKIASVIEESALTIYRLSGGKERRGPVLRAIAAHCDEAGYARRTDGKWKERPETVDFLRRFDLFYRTRRLRFVARSLERLEEVPGTSEPAEAARGMLYEMIGRYRAPVEADRSVAPAIFREAEARPAEAMAALADMLDLVARDAEADQRLSEMLETFPGNQRRALILTYLGFPFYDVATLPLLEGEGLDEFDPIKVDRIAPDDATSIREGGAAATLKGLQLNSFGAFFSRAYRENDYLWGRLHGAERLIDIVVSAIPEGRRLPAGTIATLKRDAFRAILDEEADRLTSIPALIEEIRGEIG